MVDRLEPDQGSDLNILNGVSCTSQTRCAAVGYYVDGSLEDSQESLTESYDGTAWTITPSPVGEAGIDYYLRSVSCSGPTSCFAVGSGTLIEGLERHVVVDLRIRRRLQRPERCLLRQLHELCGCRHEKLRHRDAIEDLERDQVVGRLDSQYSYGRLAGLRELLRLLQLRGGRQLHTVRFVDATDLAETGSIPPPPTPTIRKFSPTAGPPGTTVVIKGTNLLAASSVMFNGVEATITLDKAKKIR